MSKPRLLDLFCCAGGAGMGYARAGFEVVGVDLDPKPLRHNPHEHYVGDALAVLDTLLAGGEWQGYHLRDFDAMHASAPCQHASVGAARWRVAGRTYPALIEPTRERLLRTGLPWIMENVTAAKLHNALTLCGTMFGLNVIRHRLFETSVPMYRPRACRHVGSIKGKTATYCTVAGHGGHGPSRYADWCEAMGIDWMTKQELTQAVPPAYTEWLGRQLLAAIEGERAA